MLEHANPTAVNIQDNNIFHISHHSYENKNGNSTLLEKLFGGRVFLIVMCITRPISQQEQNIVL